MAQSEWFGSVTVNDTSDAEVAFLKVEQLLTSLRPASVDRSRSTASFTDVGVQIDIHHTSRIAKLSIDLHYGADGGGMFYPLGYEEYYRLPDQPPVEQDALADLSGVLVNAFIVEKTYWKGRAVRTVVTQVEPGERATGSSISGWLLSPRWFIPKSALITRSHRYSYGGQRPVG